MADNIVLNDYEKARDYASTIRGISNSVKGLFEDHDGLMKVLYGTTWQSTGSEDSAAFYKRMFQEKYEPIFNKLIATSETIIAATNTLEAGDKAADQTITEE